MVLPASRVMDSNAQPPADCRLDAGQFASKAGPGRVGGEGWPCGKGSR